MVLVVGRFEALGLAPDDVLEVVPTGLEGLAPLRDVGVVFALPGPVRRLVDGDLEPRMEDDFARPPAVLRNDLGRDVAPPDDGESRHGSGRSLDGEGDGRGEVAVTGRAPLE